MTNQELMNRFEELEAGRIFGDLEADEIREWEELSKDPRCQGDPSLELLATALDIDFDEECDEELPASLRKALEEGMKPFVVAEATDDKVIRPSIWKKIFSDTETAWAVAAVCLLLLVAQMFVDESPEKRFAGSPEALVAQADDVIQSKFGGTEAFGQMSGEVVWSDELQEGYMTLTNLPANDPTLKQYQLWIVDPDRDEKPVDGGVFDIPADSGTAIIPIRNPLVVRNPQAFVITLEQPGGVVVSKQEVVVALATAS